MNFSRLRYAYTSSTLSPKPFSYMGEDSISNLICQYGRQISLVSLKSLLVSAWGKVRKILHFVLKNYLKGEA